MSSFSIARIANAGVDGFEFVANNGGKLIVPTLLGAVGGYLMGVGGSVGAVQGLSSAVLHRFVFRPAGQYIEKNKGEGPDQFHQNTAYVLYTMGVISNIALPILLTSYGADPALAFAASSSPSMIKWMFEGTTGSYTAFKGLLVNVAPGIAQHVIAELREEDKKQKRT